MTDLVSTPTSAIGRLAACLDVFALLLGLSGAAGSIWGAVNLLYVAFRTLAERFLGPYPIEPTVGLPLVFGALAICAADACLPSIDKLRKTASEPAKVVG